jgi:hypothetical protein
MRFLYVLSALAAVAFATPNPSEAANSLEERSCLPASCQSYGVSSKILPLILPKDKQAREKETRLTKLI